MSAQHPFVPGCNCTECRAQRLIDNQMPIFRKPSYLHHLRHVAREPVKAETRTRYERFIDEARALAEDVRDMQDNEKETSDALNTAMNELSNLAAAIDDHTNWQGMPLSVADQLRRHLNRAVVEIQKVGP